MSWEEIQKLQMEIYQNYDKISQLRKELEPEKVGDYTFLQENGDDVQLSQLFKDDKPLIVIHNMGKSCSYCTAWADGYSGIYSRIEEHATFVVSSPDAPEVQSDFKKERGWVFPMVSLGDSGFAEEMGYYSEHGYHPGVSIFTKDGEQIYRTFHHPFGPSDHYGILWHTLDMLPVNPMN